MTYYKICFSSSNRFKIDINNNKLSRSPPNLWQLNNTSLNKLQFIEKYYNKIRKYFKRNDNENTAFQSLHYPSKAALRGKFIPLNANISKEERLKFNDLHSHLRTDKNKSK